jgi:hypothetical protein
VFTPVLCVLSLIPLEAKHTAHSHYIVSIM